MYTSSLSDRVNLRPALEVGRWGSSKGDHAALKTTSKPTNKRVRRSPTIWSLPHPYSVLMGARESLHGALSWLNGGIRLSSLRPWVAVLHQKSLRQREEFLDSRSIKTEGCCSWAGIRVETSSFFYFFLFPLFSPPPISVIPSRDWRAGVGAGCMWGRTCKVQRMHPGPFQGTDCSLWVISTQPGARSPLT